MTHDETSESGPRSVIIDPLTVAEQIESRTSEIRTPLDACLACPHFKRLCRSTVSGLFGLIGRRPPAT